MLYETIAISLFGRLLTSTLLVARAIATGTSCSQSELYDYWFCILPPRIFEERQTVCGLWHSMRGQNSINEHIQIPDMYTTETLTHFKRPHFHVHLDAVFEGYSI